MDKDVHLPPILRSGGGIRSLAWLTLSSDEISIWGHIGSVCHVGHRVPKCTPDVLSASHTVLASLKLVAELDRGEETRAGGHQQEYLEKKTLLI